MKKQIIFALIGVLALSEPVTFAQEGPQPTTSQPPTFTLGIAPYRDPNVVLPQAFEPQIITPAVSFPTLSVDTSIRRASRNFYNAIYSVSDEFPANWTGNVTNGVAGDTSQDFKDAVALRINFVRALAGVPGVITFSSTWNGEDQQAALIMSANDTLTHDVQPSMTDYTAQGAEAAGKSNITLGTYGPDAVMGYIQDPGTSPVGSNAIVGHRRWLLYPPTLQMGTGDIALPTDGFKSANAIWVIESVSHPYPTLRDGFVAWPPKGYVPYQFVFPRWSFSLKNADFTNATVSVIRAGTAVGTTIVDSTDVGHGDNTIVWTLAGADDGSAPLAAPLSDTTYAVTISNVIVSGTPHMYSYNVIVFDPSVTGLDDILPTFTANTASAGLTTNLPFTTLPEASSYDVWSATLQTASWVEGAEVNPPVHLTAETTGSYAYITSASHASGSKSFQLVQDEFENQDLVLNSEFVASATSSISFKSLYGYMTDNQFAEVQVSLDNGASWTSISSRVGTGNSQSSFSLQTVNLSAYANRIIRIRFQLEFINIHPLDGAFNTDGTDVGWLIDDITPVNLLEASNITETPIAGTPYAFASPAQPATVPLAVRAVLFNTFPLEYGPVANVSVVPASTTPFITSATTAGGTLGTVFGGYTVTASATGSPTQFGATNLPPGLSINSTTGVISGTPTQAGIFSTALTATNTVTNDVGHATLTFTIAKAAATVNLGSLSATYDQTAKAATATTTPSNLTVNFTYNGSSTAPTAAGSYTVVGTISDPNYAGTSSGTLVIAKATLTVGLTGTVTKVYDGTTAATLTNGNYTLSAPIGGDVVTLNHFANGTYADKNVGANKQVTVTGLTLSGAAGGNYQLNTTTLAASVGSITTAPLTVAANSVQKTYDGKLYTGATSVSYTGFVHNETTAVLGGALTYGGSWQAAVNAGPYTITPGGLTSGNYSINFTNGTLTIAPAPITVTIKAGTSIYGQDLSHIIPGLTVTGLLNGDAITSLGYTSVITGTGAGITPTTDASSVKYSLTIVGSLTNGNYALKSGAASPVGKLTTWTVTQDVVTISGLTGTSIYGQTPATPVQLYTFTSSNGVTDQAALLNLLVAPPTISSYVFNITNTTDAGTYSTDTIISALLAGGVNTHDYKLVVGKKGSWIVTPDIITITGLTNGSSTYGSATGFDGTTYFTVSDQDASGNVLSFVKGVKATLSATATSNAGIYSVTTAGALNSVGGKVNGVKAADYKLVLVKGSWKINPQPVTITIGGGSSIYGVAPKVPTLTGTGIVNSKNVALTATLLKGLSTNLLSVVGKTGNAGVGTYPITLTGTPTGNYTYTGLESDTTGTWNITPATITALKVNASSTSTVGTDPINKVLAVTKLVNGDLPSGLGYTLVGMSGNLTSATPAGTYTFTVTGNFSNANYILKAGVASHPATPVGAKVTIK